MKEARYRKMGRILHYHCHIICDTIGTAAGDIRISQPPGVNFFLTLTGSGREIARTGTLLEAIALDTVGFIVWTYDNGMPASVDGDTLRFSIILGDGQNERLEKGDVVFDAEEEITCKCMAWGGKVSRRGKLLVRKTRFGIRKEWRSVGIFSCEENTETTSLGTMRVRERFTSAEMIDSSSSSSL